MIMESVPPTVSGPGRNQTFSLTAWLSTDILEC